MIRKSSIEPKKSPASPKINANSGVDPERDVLNIERELFECSPLPVAALAGSKHTFQYVNTAFCRVAGKTRDELTGKPFSEVMPWV